MPAQHRLRLDNEERLAPRGHAAGEEDQQGAINRGAAGPLDAALQDEQLVAIFALSALGRLVLLGLCVLVLVRDRSAIPLM